MDKDTGRVEAFSDGVFAIAITLLILEIRVPELHEPLRSGQLVAALTELWPSFVAFLLSFFVILVMWVNHHELVRWVTIVDYPFLFANGFVLLIVTFIPFPTAVMARYLGTDAERAAVGFYCATYLCVSIAYGVLLQTIIYRNRLLRRDIPAAAVARVRRAYHVGPFVYATSVALSAWNAAVGLTVCMSLWVLWTRLCYDPPHQGAQRDAA